MGEKSERIGEGTRRSNMNVLMIGLDSTLAMDKDKVIGDSQDRHILYGEYVSNLFIVVYSGKGLKTRELSDKVTVYPTCSKNLHIPLSNLFVFSFDAYRIAKRICQEYKIDVITTQDPLLTGLVGYLLRKKFKIPLNVQLHGDYLDNKFWLKESRLNYFMNMLGKFIVKKADSIRVVSNKVGEKLMLKLNIPDEKLISFPVFTNIAKFIVQPSVNPRENFLEFKNIVLFVGRLSTGKNVETLLMAAKEVLEECPKTLFLIVGDGRVRGDLEKLAQQLKAKQNVRFEGAVNYEDILRYYQSCDLLVLPSKHEGWGRVAIEGLACAKPVIVSDACGISELVIERECGFTFPPDRPDILAEKIMYLFENPGIREEMGERGRRYVKGNLDIKKNAYKYRELYEKTIELARRA